MMDGDNTSESSDAAPASGSDPPPLSFVTATTLSDFKTPSTMRQVRRAVMHTYLNKAGNDPTSTDVRVTRRRAGMRAKKPQPATAQDPGTSSGLTRLLSATDSGSSGQRRDSRVSDISESTGDPSSAFHTDAFQLMTMHSPASGVMATAGPPVSDASQPTAFGAFSLPSASHNYVDEFGQSIGERPSKRSHSEPQILEAVSRFSLDTPGPSFPPGFVGPNSFSRGTLGLGTSREHSVSSYDNDPLKEAEWFVYTHGPPNTMPMPNQSTSSPLREALGASPPRISSSFGSPGFDSLLELAGVLPQSLQESLSDPNDGFSDSNIAAVLQHANTELSSGRPRLMRAYQAHLKKMVMARGGLDKIGDSGIIAIHVSITDIEASFFRNEPADPMYLTFALRYLKQHPPQHLAYDQVLDTSIPDRKRNPWRWVRETESMHKIIALARDATNYFLQMLAVESQLAEADSETDLEELKAALQSSIFEVHRMPSAAMPGHDGYNDPCYETLRLTVLLYTHAIYWRVPLHQAPNGRCPPGDYLDCTTSPSLISAELSKVTRGEAWERSAIALYWACAIAGAACHQEEQTLGGIEPISTSSRRSSVQQAPLLTPNTARGQNAAQSPQSAFAAAGSLASQYALSRMIPGSSSPASASGYTGRNFSQIFALESSPRRRATAQAGKRRREPPEALQPAPIWVRAETSEAASTRSHLIATAVDASILLRFEHTSELVHMILRAGQVRDALASFQEGHSG